MVRRLYPNDPNARPLHAQNLHILLADDNKTRMLYEVHNAEFEPPSRRTHEVLWSKGRRLATAPFTSGNRPGTMLVWQS